MKDKVNTLIFVLNDEIGWIGFMFPEGTEWDEDDAQMNEVFGVSSLASYGYDAYSEIVARNGGSPYFPRGTDMWAKIREVTDPS